VGISASFPEFLCLLLLIPLLWLAALRLPQRLSGRRLWASLALRSALIGCLVLALAGAQLRLPARSSTTVFLVDASHSVSAEQRDRAEAFVREALAAMRPNDRAGVVTFGQEALVTRALDTAPQRYALPLVPSASATDIRAAIQLGLALLPADGYRRLVLLSDGAETTGDALAAARSAATRGVPVDVVPLAGRSGGLDAEVSRVDMPQLTYAGQRPRMRVQLESTAAAQGHLRVTDASGRTLARAPVTLAPGRQEVTIDLPEAGPSFSRYQVRLELPGDSRPENDAAETFTVVRERARVLLVASELASALPLERALAAAQIVATTVPPGEMPNQLAELALFDAVALIDVPRHALPERADAELARYVRDLGRGLMMVGGPNAFGPGGWRGSQVEEALPVTMDIPPLIQRPPASVVVVIDISGSMSEVERGRSKLSLALEGAQQIAGLLRDEDELTVLPFDYEPSDVVGPLDGRRRHEAVEAIGRVRLGGGGINMRDALAEAARLARGSDRPVRHIITLTDGDDTAQQEGALPLIEELRGEGVTLSSIAIGDGEHVAFIEQMPVAGGGRYFFTDSASTLPAILVNEAQQATQSYLAEQPFAPALGAPHPLAEALGAAPQLRGHVLTSARQTAQVVLASPSGEPVLATWQYGLGRSLAWTSDLSGRWAADWVAWEGFPEVAGQLVSWVLPQAGGDGLTLSTEARGGELLLQAQLGAGLAGGQADLRLTARLTGGDGHVREVALRQVGPGAYAAAVQSPPGAYEVQLVAADQSGLPVERVTGGAVAPPSAEYRIGGASGELLPELARITGGRQEPLAAQMFSPAGRRGEASQDIGLALLWLALALLPLDIALRRQTLDREALVAMAGRLGKTRPARYVRLGLRSARKATLWGKAGGMAPRLSQLPVAVPVEAEERRARKPDAEG
jgi:uncharacterized membrane protein